MSQKRPKPMALAEFNRTLQAPDQETGKTPPRILKEDPRRVSTQDLAHYPKTRDPKHRPATRLSPTSALPRTAAPR